MKFSFWWAALPVVLLAAIGVAEFAARLWLRVRDEYYVWTPCYRGEFELEPGMPPNLPSPVRFTVNREGERGSEIPRNVHKLYRVLVAGGSAPECYSLDQEATWPMGLQRILERPQNLKKLGASHVHVGSIARSGVGAEALELILRMVSRRGARLDTVIIMVGGTDVRQWLRAGAPATPVRAINTTSDISEYFAWHPHGPFSWRPKQTALAEIARRLQQVGLRPVVRRQGLGRWVVRARKMRANALEVRTEVQNPHVVVDNFELHFRRALNTAKAKADRVIVARQPWLEKNELSKEESEYFWNGAVGDIIHEEVKIFYSEEVLFRLMTQIDERAARVAQEIGVECVELRSAIEPSFNSYCDLVHFTPSGAATVARILASVVLREPATAQSRAAAALQIGNASGV